MPPRPERSPDVVRAQIALTAAPAYDSELSQGAPEPPIERLDDELQTLYGHDVPVGRRRLLAGRLAGCAALLAGGQYLAWRVGTVAGTGAAGGLFWLAEALNFAGLVMTVALIWRVQRRSVPHAADMTIDVFVTVCGEPVRMVERTLRAAIAIEGPVALYVLNDGKIADKASWREIDELCARLGITCFTRSDGVIGKAANLNYALARTDGELLLTLDADHLADRSAARQLSGYFRDHRVAFVTTPQRFHASDDNALNNRELFFYQVIQPAKDFASSAFSCGNGVAYRRAALESIGGFSEWNTVEDVHTSYELHAAGWRSAYHNHPVTIGDAPGTLAELTRQRHRWAMDSARLFFWDNPLLKRGLTWGQRLHYVHTTGFYLIAATQVAFIVSPALYLLAGQSVMRVTSIDELLWHSVPYYVAIVAFFVSYSGFRESLRILRQQLALSPVYLLAVTRSMLHRPVPSSVTEKSAPPLVSWALLPVALLLALSLAALGAAIVDPRPGATLAGLWAAWFAFALGGPIAEVSRSPRFRRALRATVSAIAMAAVVILVATPWQRSVGGIHRMALATPARGVYLGVFNQAALRDGRSLESWSRRHGVRPAIVNSYQQWLSNDTEFRADRARMVAELGAVLMITWEPWAKPPGRVHGGYQPAVSLRRIAAGRYDAYIRGWARAAAGYGQPLLIRPMQEMNGDWYPWAYGRNGNTKRYYVAAWRRIHDLFRRAGATNVAWVWTINSFAGLPRSGRRVLPAYPGDKYVDWVSATGFNWGGPRIPPRTAKRVFEGSLHALDRLGKPIMISEVGTAAGRRDPAGWVAGALAELPRRHPNVRAIIWFDDRYSARSDFRLRGNVGAAFDAAVRANRDLHARPRVIPAAG
jgi:cellulose synthase (UDP-forming)